MNTEINFGEKTYDLLSPEQREELFELLQIQIGSFISKKLGVPIKSKKQFLFKKIKKALITTLHYIEEVLGEIENFFFNEERKEIREFNKQIQGLEDILVES
jgi:hypothetical protein